MKIYTLKQTTKKSVLALGAESAGNFSVLKKNKLFFSPDFGDLARDDNYTKFKSTIYEFLHAHKISLDTILSDRHPLFRTTGLAKSLSRKYNARHISVQHHYGHIFSAWGENNLACGKSIYQTDFLGIACDGTGYESDNEIWGGEVLSINKSKIDRVGHLENQTLIGGDLAAVEPVRMIIGILSKLLNKNEIYKLVKKFYSQNRFELIFNQCKQNFNCYATSSTARILDAVSVLLGFAGNQRRFKHQSAQILEKNSTTPFILKPSIIYDQKTQCYILNTTMLFDYLLTNIKRDKKRLAATAQIYLARGLYEICSGYNKANSLALPIFFGGGLANNRILSGYLQEKGVIANKKIPRGDAGISFGQIFYYLARDKRA